MLSEVLRADFPRVVAHRVNGGVEGLDLSVLVVETERLRAAITPQWGGKVWSLLEMARLGVVTPLNGSTASTLRGSTSTAREAARSVPEDERLTEEGIRLSNSGRGKEALSVFWMNLKTFSREKILDPSGTTRLSARMIGLKATSRGQPDREVVINHLCRVSITKSLENPSSILELFLVEHRCARVILFRHGPLVFAPIDPIPIETIVNR